MVSFMTHPNPPSGGMGVKGLEMIVGIGSDLANIERIEESIERFGDRFVDRVFSDAEKQEMEKRKKVSPRRYASAAAKRFAAKEAFSKAIGTGLRRGTFWRDMEVLHMSTGKPYMKISGGALEHLKRIAGEDYQVSVSMSDDWPWAQAFVVVEKL